MPPRPPSPIRQPQRVQAFFLKMVPFCQHFAGIGSTNTCATSHTLVLCLLRFPLLRPSFYHALSIMSGRNYLICSYSLLSGYNGSPASRYFRVITRLISWFGGVRCSSHPLCHAGSLLFLLMCTILFSWTGEVLSRWNFSTHRFPRYALSNLCFLVTLVVFFVTMDIAFC